MDINFPGFERHALDEDFHLWVGELPRELRVSPPRFDRLWSLHPENYHIITIHGKRVRTPRWQQAYNRDYRYTGARNAARPVPGELKPLFRWAKRGIDSRLNGLLVNWYDGRLRHYIGRHRDRPDDLLPGSPIVTISLGETRKFRLRPWKRKGFIDFEASDGTVFILPWETNLSWTHEVPHSRDRTGRRISVTIRAFVT